MILFSRSFLCFIQSFILRNDAWRPLIPHSTNYHIDVAAPFSLIVEFVSFYVFLLEDKLLFDDFTMKPFSIFKILNWLQNTFCKHKLLSPTWYKCLKFHNLTAVDASWCVEICYWFSWTPHIRGLSKDWCCNATHFSEIRSISIWHWHVANKSLTFPTKGWSKKFYLRPITKVTERFYNIWKTREFMICYPPI